MSAAERYAQQVEKVRALQEEYEQQVKAHQHAMEAVAMARAAIPDSLRQRLERAARQPKRSTIREFFNTVYQYLPDKWTVAAAVIELYRWYVAMHEEQQMASHRPDWNFSGMGPMAAWNPPPPPMAPPEEGWGTFAPASPNESVVDAVFAKEEEARERQCVSN